MYVCSYIPVAAGQVCLSVLEPHTLLALLSAEQCPSLPTALQWEHQAVPECVRTHVCVWEEVPKLGHITLTFIVTAPGSE